MRSAGIYRHDATAVNDCKLQAINSAVRLRDARCGMFQYDANVGCKFVEVVEFTSQIFAYNHGIKASCVGKFFAPSNELIELI